MDHPSPLTDHFGRALWRYRRLACLSQEDLARLVDLHRSEIGLLELGLRTPRLPTILKLAAGVEVSPCKLTEGLRWRPGTSERVDGAYRDAPPKPKGATGVP